MVELPGCTIISEAFKIDDNSARVRTTLAIYVSEEETRTRQEIQAVIDTKLDWREQIKKQMVAVLKLEADRYTTFMNFVDGAN